MIKFSDQIDLDQLVEDHGASVYRVCRRITGDPSIAWDAFQETIVALTVRQDSLDTTEDLGPWLREVARRCSLAALRKRTSRNTTSIGEDARGMSFPFSAMDEASRQESQRILREEFELLPEQDRRLLLLAYVDGIPHREIARRCGFPTGSTHARLREAKSRLELRLKKRGVAAAVVLLLFLFQDKRSCFAATSSTRSQSQGRVSADKSTPRGPSLVRRRLTAGAFLVLALTGSAFGLGADRYWRSSEKRFELIRVDSDASQTASQAAVSEVERLQLEFLAQATPDTEGCDGSCGG